jgi:hypothetical protein
MLDGDEGLLPMVWRFPPPLPLFLNQQMFWWTKIQVFAGYASCCILLCACCMGDLCSCVCQHLVTLAELALLI